MASRSRICSSDGDQEETIKLCNEDLTELFGQSEEMSEDTLDTVNMILYIKDWYNLSDGTYHELAKVCAQMPRQYRLRERITELNQLWKIQPTPVSYTHLTLPTIYSV